MTATIHTTDDDLTNEQRQTMWAVRLGCNLNINHPVTWIWIENVTSCAEATQSAKNWFNRYNHRRK